MNAPVQPSLVGCAICPTKFFSVYEEARGTADDDILDKAYSENWILITNDKDFGEKVYRDKRPHHGVIFLRLQDERAVSKIDAIEKLLDRYEDQLADAFAVVAETQVRFGHA
jgi:predicted nuclease of predicted toxin-antitoxin system